MRVPFYVHPGVDVRRPTKSDPLSAGTDFYIPVNALIELNPGCKDIPLDEIRKYIPEGCRGYDSVKLSPDGVSKITLYPGENIKIHSGISMEVDFGQMSMVCNRSGIASKESCVIGACIIDTFYTGEVCFDIHNNGFRPIEIKGDMKITQLIMVPIISASFLEVSKEDLYADMQIQQVRGDAGFGASDSKK